MSYRYDHRDSYGWDLPFGVILGLLFGFLGGVLFAPKPGKELQKDVQAFVDRLPENLNEGISTSKVRYKEIVGKTKQSIESQMEQRTQRKNALKMAEAKRREDQEYGYDY